MTQARRTEQLRAEAAQKEEQVAADAGKTHDIASLDMLYTAPNLSSHPLPFVFVEERRMQEQERTAQQLADEQAKEKEEAERKQKEDDSWQSIQL